MTDNLVFQVGDLFTSTQPALAHGVNVKGVMGAGIAVPFRKLFPEIFAPYFHACDTGILVPGSVLPIKSRGRLILNVASQDKPGPFARLEWLEDGLTSAIEALREEGLTGFAMPRIGAGIGGLEWDDVVEVLERLAADNPDITIEVWSL